MDKENKFEDLKFYFLGNVYCMADRLKQDGYFATLSQVTYCFAVVKTSDIN